MAFLFPLQYVSVVLYRTELNCLCGKLLDEYKHAIQSGRHLDRGAGARTRVPQSSSTPHGTSSNGESVSMAPPDPSKFRETSGGAVSGVRWYADMKRF